MNILPYFLKAMFQKALSISNFPIRLSKVLYPHAYANEKDYQEYSAMVTVSLHTDSLFFVKGGHLETLFYFPGLFLNKSWAVFLNVYLFYVSNSYDLKDYSKIYYNIF